MTTAQSLMITRNRAYSDYLKATDITERAEKLRIYKELCLAADAAYRQEIKGDLL